MGNDLTFLLICLCSEEMNSSIVNRLLLYHILLLRHLFYNAIIYTSYKDAIIAIYVLKF